MLDLSQKNFLKAVKKFINNDEKIQLDIDSQEQIIEIMNLAQQQQMLPMVYDAVSRDKCYEKYGRIIDLYRRSSVLLMMSQTKRTSAFLTLYKKMLDLGIKPVIVKGIVLRQMYEKKDCRCSNDEDLIVDERQFFKCDDFLISEGFERNMDFDCINKEKLPYEVSYYNKITKVRLELHTKLLPENKMFAELNKTFKNALKRAVKVETDSVDIWTLNYTDHFLFLLSHSFKHFIFCGFGIRQLCDILTMAQKHGSEIDWKYIENTCIKTRMDRFFINLIDIGERYLGFDKENIPWYLGKEDIADSGSLLQDLLESGAFGKTSMGRIHSSGITMNSVEKSFSGKKKDKEKVRISFFRSIFPEVSYMRQNYPYLKKTVMLLPVAYCERILKYIKRRKIQSGYLEETDSIAIGKKRLELMKKYGVI